MKQIQMTEYGAVDVLKEKETAIPSPGPGEILIKVKSIGVNYSDLSRRQNSYFMPTRLPYVLGTEVVGAVAKIGAGVQENLFQCGRKIMAILPDGGGYSEYVAANSHYCVLLPSEMDENQATAIFVQRTSAHLLIHQVAGDLSGKTILVHAASGGVGSLLVQLGKLTGAKVVAAASSEEKLRTARELGADILINYVRQGWTDELSKMNNGAKMDFIFDGVGGNVLEECFEALGPAGAVIVYGAVGGNKAMIDSGRFIEQNQNMLGFNLGHYIQNSSDLWQTSLKSMVELLASKKLMVRVSYVYPLSEASQAHRDIEDRKTVGTVVLSNPRFDSN